MPLFAKQEGHRWTTELARVPLISMLENKTILIKHSISEFLFFGSSICEGISSWCCPSSPQDAKSISSSKLEMSASSTRPFCLPFLN